MKPPSFRAYLAWLGSGALAVAAISLASIYLLLGSQMEPGRWAAESLEKKALAVSTRSPDVVILSGSNAHFGFSAQRLSELHGIKAVNASVDGGLGVSYILHYGRQFLAPGRLFVIPLEYELYGRTSMESAYRYQVIGFDTGYFRAMSLRQKLAFVVRMSPADRIRFLKQNIRRTPRNSVNGYQSRTVNTWGDETKNTLSDRPDSTLTKLHRTATKKYTIDDDVWEEITQFVRDAHAAGSRVVLAQPNIYEKALDVPLNRDFFTQLEGKAAALGITIVDRPGDSAFGDDLAYDTFYHLNTDGTAKSTDRLAKALTLSGAL
jgi:hypothetical protein